MKTFPQVTIAIALMLAAPAVAEPIAKPPQEKAGDAAKVKLKFQAYDGDPAKPESMTFQINTIGLRQPSSFLAIGEQIENTKYRITSFKPKTEKDPKTGYENDVSELTLTHTVTKETIKLTMNTAVPIDQKAEVHIKGIK